MISSIRLIYCAACFLLVLGLGITWTNLSHSAGDTEQRLLLGDVVRAEASAIERRLARSLYAAYFLALELQKHKGEYVDFDADAAQIIELLGGISSLQLAPNAIIEKIYPLEGNEAALGLNLLEHEGRREEAVLAIENRELTLAGPFKLAQGGVGMIGFYPVFVTRDGEENFWGFTQALIKLDDLLSSVDLQRLQSRGYSYQLHHIDPVNGEIEVFVQSKMPLTQNSYSQDIMVPNTTWILTISPASPGLLESKYPGYLLSLVFALLLSFLLFHGLKSNQMLREARNIALRANNARDEFLAGVSHEIRTPLSGMTGVLRLLKRSRLDRNQVRYIDTAVSSGEMLQVVIDDLLGLSRAGEDGISLNTSSFDLAEMVEDVAYMLALEANQHSLDLVIETGDTIPWLIKSDPVRVRQVLHSLLSNSIRFCDHGMVLIYARREGDFAQIGIIDSSAELNEEQRQVHSDPLVDNQATSRSRSDNAGLGLSLSRRLVEALGSELQIEADAGGGNHFYFKIPLDPATMDVYDWNPPKTLQELSIAILSPLQQRLDSYRKTFGNWGIKDIQVLDYDCDEATGLPLIQPCQLVIVDQSRSEQSVDDLIDSMRNHSDWRDTFFIHLLPQGNETGSADVRLEKPISRAELFAVLLDIIYRKSFDNEYQGETGDAQEQSKKPLDGKRLLLVEDDQINKIIALEILSETAVQIDVAVDGEHALEQVKRQDYDLVLMDINLPVMDGYQATRAIREMGGKFSNLPIIAMTAYAQHGDASKSAAAGMNDHITKPFDSDEFLAIIIGHIEGSARRG